MRTLVLGLGNPIMGDDGVGLRVAQELQGRLSNAPFVDVEECFAAGVALLDKIVGYDALIVVDALRSEHPPGTILEFKPEDLPSQPETADFHGMGLLAVLKLGERLSLKMPHRVSLVCIAVQGDFEASESLSLEVEQAVPQAVERVLAEVRCLLSA